MAYMQATDATENAERFLERHEVFASGFGRFARMVVYLADLYLSNAELGPIVREVLEHNVKRFKSWLAGISQRGLIAYDASEDPSTYVHPGVHTSAEDMRSAVRQTFRKSKEGSKDAITDDLNVLVTAANRQLGMLCFVPEDVKPSFVEDFIRNQQYTMAFFRLSFRHPQRMHFEDEDRELVAEYLRRVRKDEVPANAGASSSESTLNDYVYFTIAVALVIVAARRYVGTITEKLKATCGYAKIILEQLKETSKRTYERIDVFRRFLDGRLAEALHVVAELKETSIRTYESIDVFSWLRDGRIADALHEKEVECQQLRDANAVLNEALEAMRERLRSLQEEIVHCEAFNEQASVREADLKSEIYSLRSVAEQCVEHERLQEEHYAQAREISRRKEAALKERLDEQCLISESLNDAVEEMQRLITAMIEANDAMTTTSLQAGVQGAAPDRQITTEARQSASRPDVPVDPVTNAAPSNAMARDDDAIQRFATTVYITLYSVPHGYDSISRLLHDLSEDSGLDGETVAIELGYASFEAFLHSPEMAPRILVGADPDGRPRYKVYPTKADLERYVAQQLGTDYGDTKRALARQRDENNRLRSQLASTMERVEKLKSEALVKQQTKPVMLDASRFRPSFTKTPADNIRDTFPRTDLTSRFRPADSKKDVDGPSTSRAARDGPAPPSVRGQAPQEKSALSLASPDGRPRYKVYPTEADLERYVTQQLGTDYGDTKRALARQRDENNRLRSQLASTMERVEKLKSEALAKHQPKPALVASRFRASSTKTHTTDDNTRGTFPRTDLASRFRPANAEKNIDGPSTSRAANDVPAPPSGSGQALQVESTLSLDVRRHIDDLERTVHCGICMDRSKDTAFACGHAYCNECAVELKQCTFGCKKQNGKPLTFKYRLFL